MKDVKRMSIPVLVLLLLASLFLLSACNNQQKVSEQTDVLTQKVVPEGKIPVTVLMKNAFSINTFEKAVEEKFPQLDIIQIGNFTSDRGLVEYERRMANDDLADIVMTWPLDVGEQYWDERLLDLSGMSFTSNYNTAMLDSIAKEGKLYYLPGPAQVRGIVYNKTLFAERGWQVPEDFDGFIKLCQTIEASGMRALQLGFANAEVLDTAFVGYSYGDCFCKPSDATWLENYNNGVGDFGEQFKPALDTFQLMIEQGIWRESDLDVSYADREKMLFTRQCAMAEDSVLLARMGQQFNGCTDEFALMPFFSPNADNDWARLYMVCYIGLNQHLAEPNNKEKYDLVMQVMDYISSPEGQLALAGDTGAMYSSVNDVPPPDIPEIEHLVDTLNQGRYAIFPELANAQGALREGLAGMLKGTLSSEDVIQMVNNKNVSHQADEQEMVIGTATADFTLIETGNYITDVMRAKSGADVALFLDNGKDGRSNGKGVSGRFYKGEQTKADLSRILPDLRHGEKGVLQTVTMTGANLLQALEYSLNVDNNMDGWFYYFSGLRMDYAPAAEPGSRISKITDADGKDIDAEQIYTVAIMDGSVDEAYIESCEGTDILLMTLLCEAIQEDKTITPSGDGRFSVRQP